MKLYKYRSFGIGEEAPTIKNNLTLKTLFEYKCWISSRVSFNDPFDSHMNFATPDVRSIKKAMDQVDPVARSIMKTWISDNRTTDTFDKFLFDLNGLFTKLIDRYGIICFSSEIDNNLLWSHYSSNHTGFCIEFDSEFIIGNNEKPKACRYRPKLYGLPTQEFLTLGKDITNIDFGRQVQDGLLTKLHHWSYEKEYRLVLKGKMDEGMKGYEKILPSGSITSVIFGARCDTQNMLYMVNNLPFRNEIKFKKANIDLHRSKITIEDLHL